MNEISMDEVCVLLGRKDVDIYLGQKREVALNHQIQTLIKELDEAKGHFSGIIELA